MQDKRGASLLRGRVGGESGLKSADFWGRNVEAVAGGGFVGGLKAGCRD